MNEKNKNGVKTSKKTSASKKYTKKDLELIITTLEDKQLRLKAEFDNFRKRKDTEIISLLKYEGKNFIIDFLDVLDNLSRGIDSYKGSLDAIINIKPEEVKDKINTGHQSIIDVRNSSEHSNGYVSNSTHIPLKDLLQNLSLLNSYFGSHFSSSFIN